MGSLEKLTPAEGEQEGSRAAQARMSDLYPLFAIAFVVELGLGIVSPILPEIMREFTLTAWQIGMMVTVLGLARLVTDLPLGYFLDRVNRTWVLCLGIVLIAGGSAGCGFAPDYYFLLAARLVTGIGTALCLVTLLFTVSRLAGAGDKGRAIGFYQASLLGGVSFGPAIGGLAASLFNWRAAFLFCTAMSCLALLMVSLLCNRGFLSSAFLPSTKKEKQQATPEQHTGWQIPWNLVSINFTTFVFVVSNMGFRNSVLPVYGGTELGIGVGTLGILLGGAAVIRFFVTVVSGVASDRYGRKAILYPGVAFLVTGTLGFTLAGDLFGFVLCLTIISLGGFGNSLPTTMVVDAVHPDRLGFAISVNRFIGDLGLVIGPVFLGWILDVAGFPTVTAVTACMLLATVPGVAITVKEKKLRG
jgi:DHA1 family multidrug resistance protein-like MFS transporter